MTARLPVAPADGNGRDAEKWLTPRSRAMHRVSERSGLSPGEAGRLLDSLERSTRRVRKVVGAGCGVGRRYIDSMVEGEAASYVEQAARWTRASMEAGIDATLALAPVEWLASLFGYRLAPMAEAAEGDAFLRRYRRLRGELAEADDRMLADHEDGECTVDEARETLAELADLMGEIEKMAGYYRAIVESATPDPRFNKARGGGR